MEKTILKEVAKIVIVVVQSSYRILVLAVMVTIQRSFLAVTNAVAMVNDRWPAVILSAASYFINLISILPSMGYCNPVSAVFIIVIWTCWISFRSNHVGLAGCILLLLNYDLALGYGQSFWAHWFGSLFYHSRVVYFVIPDFSVIIPTF